MQILLSLLNYSVETCRDETQRLQEQQYTIDGDLAEHQQFLHLPLELRERLEYVFSRLHV